MRSLQGSLSVMIHRSNPTRKLFSVWLLLCSLLILAGNTVSVRAFADGKSDCEKHGLSKLDCDAINGNWVNWKPKSGEGTTDQCGGSSGEPISGSNNAEMVWNFLISKELTPVAAAGIMGNFSQESSGFDPALKQNYTTRAIPDGGDGKTGFGIAQWTYQERQAGLFAKIREAGLQQYYGEGWGHPEKDKDIKAEDMQKLLTIELDYAWEGDTTKIKDIADQLNAAEGTTGDNGSTVLFHKLYERSGDNALQIQQRVNDATGFLQKYGATAGTTSCAGELGGVSTMDDAIPWALKFVSDTADAYHPGGHSIDNDRTDSRINLYVTNDDPVSGGPLAGCWRALWCGQCTALVGWFVTNMTEYTYQGGNGGEVVGLDGKGKPTGGGLAAAGVPTGMDPRPFSVFSYDTSSVGHTGIVLGVLGDGNVITIENNLSSHTLAVLKYNIKESHPDVRFAYVGDKLKVPGVSLPDQPTGQ